MFNGMMDPEMIRIAQEQMSRMSPAQLAGIQQQMMSNPELIKMASESMKNLSPDDLTFATEQLKSTRPDEMAEISEKMANASPEEIAAMRARLDSQVSYEINAAQMLKQQGNELHSQGRFGDALHKYSLAKKNLKGIPSSKSKILLLACSLNLMSCYLRTKQYDECIKEGSEVLSYDAKNVKALYRRGQAYKELGQLDDAVSDLRRAFEASPDDETIADVLRDAEERLIKEGGGRTSRRGLVIEEITEEELPSLRAGSTESSAAECSLSQPKVASSSSGTRPDILDRPSSRSSEYLQARDNDPQSIRSFQDFISHSDPETLSALGNGKPEAVSPDMVKTASSLIAQMSPEELQRMIRLASSFQGENPLLNSDTSSGRFGPSSVSPNATPEMLRTATDTMSKMSPQELQKMLEMASSLKDQDTKSTAATALSSNGFKTDLSEAQESQGSFYSRRDGSNGTSSSQGFMNSRSAPPQSGFPSSSADLQEQMRNQMKDPAMQQMFSSMIKSMSPEMMANMSKQFGLKLSRKDAEKAQQAMSSLSPDDLDRMMKWADRVQRGVEGVKQTKNWLLGRPGMIFAIVILILAFILQCLVT